MATKEYWHTTLIIKIITTYGFSNYHQNHHFCSIHDYVKLVTFQLVPQINDCLLAYSVSVRIPALFKPFSLLYWLSICFAGLLLLMWVGGAPDYARAHVRADAASANSWATVESFCFLEEDSTSALFIRASSCLYRQIPFDISSGHIIQNCKVVNFSPCFDLRASTISCTLSSVAAFFFFLYRGRSSPNSSSEAYHLICCTLTRPSHHKTVAFCFLISDHLSVKSSLVRTLMTYDPCM